MNLNSIISALLLLVGVSFAGAASPALRECQALCKEAKLRQSVLGNTDRCKPALKFHPVPKLFNGCVEGRKRAFEQACLPLCTEAELSLSSFEACQAVKKHGHKYVDWCRKGYDSILDDLKPALLEHAKNAEQYEPEEEPENEPEESVEVPSETHRKLVEELDESGEVASEETAHFVEPDQSEPVQIEPADGEPVQVVQPEAAETVQSEPAKDEPVESEPVENEPVQNEHAQTELDDAEEPGSTDAYAQQPSASEEARGTAPSDLQALRGASAEGTNPGATDSEL